MSHGALASKNTLPPINATSRCMEFCVPHECPTRGLRKRSFNFQRIRPSIPPRKRWTRKNTLSTPTHKKRLCFSVVVTCFRINEKSNWLITRALHESSDPQIFAGIIDPITKAAYITMFDTGINHSIFTLHKRRYDEKNGFVNALLHLPTASRTRE